jgi:hypothetical protein
VEAEHPGVGSHESRYATVPASADAGSQNSRPFPAELCWSIGAAEGEMVSAVFVVLAVSAGVVVIAVAVGWF